MNTTRKIALTCIFVLAVFGLMFLLWSINQNPDNNIELAKGSVHNGSDDSLSPSYLNIFINKNGEIKLEAKDKNYLNSEFCRILEEYKINDFAKSYLGSPVIIYKPTRQYVLQDGKIHLQNKIFEPAELEKLLNECARKFGSFDDFPISLFVDKDLPHSKVKPVIDILKKAGLTKIRFVAMSCDNNVINYFVNIQAKGDNETTDTSD